MDADNLFSKPYHLFGHSLGALITIKLCNLIREKGKILPAHLFVSGEGAPIHTREQKSFILLNDQEFVSELKKIRRYDRRLFQLSGLQEYYLPILRNDLKIAETAVFNGTLPFDFNMSVLVGKKIHGQLIKYTNGIVIRPEFVVSISSMEGISI